MQHRWWFSGWGSCPGRAYTYVYVILDLKTLIPNTYMTHAYIDGGIQVVVAALSAPSTGALEQVSLCCSGLQCVAMCYIVMHCTDVAVGCNVLYCNALHGRCSELQCVAMCCVVMQCTDATGAMYIYIRVCMCIYMYVYMNTYEYQYMYMYIRALGKYMYVYTHTYTYTYIYLHVHVCMCISIFIHIYKYIYKYIYIYI